MLDAEPDMAASAVAEDGANNHGFAGTGRSREKGCLGGIGFRGVWFIGLIDVFILDVWVIQIVAEGGAEAFLGCGGGGGGVGGGRVDWRGSRRVEAGEEKTTESVDLGHDDGF